MTVVRRVAGWLPLAFAVGFVSVTLLVADTPVTDLARYTAYALLAVMLPGTLVYRALRRTPHTLVEDLAMGVAVGLVLELAGWAVFSAADRRGWLWIWPLAVAVPFAVVPALRRHWWVRGYRPVPLGWSWTVAGVVAFFTWYLSAVFLDRNPILPTSEGTLQYLDLAYQLSLAGDAKNHLPLGVPQVAGEPLYYHWFAYVHMASTSLIGGIDLPVVALRLAVPALCAAAIVLVAVAGWRISGRPYVGAVAAVLFFGIGEVNFTNPVTFPFGTQATFVVWHGMSMIYSWVLLIALIAVLADRIGRASASTVPELGRGAWVLAGLLLFASSGAKASSIPVVAVGLAFTAVALLIATRRIPWAVVGAGLLAGVAQVFSLAVLFAFHTYGLQFGPMQEPSRYWAEVPGRSVSTQAAIVVAVNAAFLINMEIRQAGILPLLWLRGGRLEPPHWFLLGGAIAGPALYLLFSQPGGGNQYFTRAGFTFGVILSAWGWVLLLDRARLDRRAAIVLGAGTVVFGLLLVRIQLDHAGRAPFDSPFSPLVPLLRWSGALAAFGVVVAIGWFVLRRWVPGLRGRGALVALTAVLVVGAPGLAMDMAKSMASPNGGAYALVPMPKSRVDAARWVRDHSDPDDIVATNVHCLGRSRCDARIFWLSAYAERRVLVEGWGFAPRLATTGSTTPFWHPDLLRLNDAAFTAPTAEGLRELRDRHGVRWLVVDRAVGVESPELATLAVPRFDNGRLAVYEIR
ncbi:MAG TPA: hypothetical protein VFC00_20195 [Micromonosporaceae bacterium]|nr:hypothetical protein [Micromonosporaceae bacterium]